LRLHFFCAILFCTVVCQQSAFVYFLRIFTAVHGIDIARLVLGLNDQ